jgi:putative membrane protein insertion efficiency factor
MIARLFVRLIQLYRAVLSPLLGNVCRFEPSCSRYAVACIEGHGVLRGGLLSIVRLCKCHPFHPGGHDPPPPPPAARSSIG